MGDSYQLMVDQLSVAQGWSSGFHLYLIPMPGMGEGSDSLSNLLSPMRDFSRVMSFSLLVVPNSGLISRNLCRSARAVLSNERGVQPGGMKMCRNLFLTP